MLHLVNPLRLEAQVIDINEITSDDCVFYRHSKDR